MRRQAGLGPGDADLRELGMKPRCSPPRLGRKARLEEERRRCRHRRVTIISQSFIAEFVPVIERARPTSRRALSTRRRCAGVSRGPFCSAVTHAASWSRCDHRGPRTPTQQGVRRGPAATPRSPCSRRPGAQGLRTAPRLGAPPPHVCGALVRDASPCFWAPRPRPTARGSHCRGARERVRPGSAAAGGRGGNAPLSDPLPGAAAAG